MKMRQFTQLSAREMSRHLSYIDCTTCDKHFAFLYTFSVASKKPSCYFRRKKKKIPKKPTLLPKDQDRGSLARSKLCQIITALLWPNTTENTVPPLPPMIAKAEWGI